MTLKINKAIIIIYFFKKVMLSLIMKAMILKKLNFFFTFPFFLW